jgi:hypothetical protein
MEYLLTANVCLIVCFLVYKLISENEIHFVQLRIFLLASITISLLVPLNNLKIDTELWINQKPEETVLQREADKKAEMVSEYKPNLQNNLKEKSIIRPLYRSVNWRKLSSIIYISVSVIFLIRFMVILIVLVVQYSISDKMKKENLMIIKNSRYKNSFSFFNWIFIHKNELSEEEINEILTHEKIHVAQWHSLDLILIELLSAVMWFNPVSWMIRKEMQLLHEYLADKGALNTGIDRLRYQALLVNQVTEERLIRLSSSFNHSLIKKRMIMMTKNEFNQQTNLKILVLVPLVALLFIGVACRNGYNKSNVVTAVAPVKMNVLYLGLDNPIKIAASGYDASELTVDVDNASIFGKNGEYIVRPKRPGSATVTVSCDGKVIQKTTFRVKVVPSPVAAIQSSRSKIKTGGNITKLELLDAGGIVVFMANFDFDLNFEVVSFVMSATVANSMTVREEISHSGKFSEAQIDLINSLIKNQKLMIEEIVVKRPNGSKRKLSPMVFTIDD